MNRSIALIVKKGSSGTPVFASIMPTSVPISASDPIIRASEITRLDLLAHKYLGDRNLWWMIAQANGLTNGSMHATPGQELVIPISAAGR